MFERENKLNALDPHFRAVYLMQFIAVIALVGGLFLVWWDSAEQNQDAFDLLNASLEKLRERDPTIIGQPLVVLWLLLPLIVVQALRGFTGILVTPVSYRTLAWVAWGVAMLVLAHYLINYGSELDEDSPLKDGAIGIGFWLTGTSTAISGALLLAETLLRLPDPEPATQSGAAGPVDDAERLWQGDYQSCPYCGMLNDPKARKCYNCNNLLFNFTDND